MISFILFLLVAFPQIITSQKCDCMPNGIWSDWFDLSECPTTCGACSKIYKSRYCLSEDLGCPCTGEANKEDYCGTECCNYPRINASVPDCCIGVPTLKNNLYHCIDPEAEKQEEEEEDSSESLNCCPDGGIWSEWSVYEKDPELVEWRRTRVCLSSRYGCACKGNSRQVTNRCPCRRPKAFEENDPCVTKYGLLETIRSAFLEQGATCTGYTVIDFSNFRRKFMEPDPNNNAIGLAKLVYLDTQGQCHVHHIPNPEGVHSYGDLHKIWFKCDLNTLNYYADMKVGDDYVQIASLGQVYTP